MNFSNEPSHPDTLNPKKDLMETDDFTHGAIKNQTGSRPIPLWFLALSMVLLFWAGLYLAFYSGGFKAEVFNPDVVSWSGGGTAQGAAPVDLKAIGKKVFAQTCVICHQETGLGVPGQFPPLIGTEWVLSQDWHGDNHLVKQILYGMQGPITVKNMPFNNAMAPWNQLSDEQIAGVLTYIRSSWGNDAPPITPEFVAKVRAETKPRTEPWTMAELKACPKEMCTPSPGASAPAK